MAAAEPHPPRGARWLPHPRHWAGLVHTRPRLWGSVAVGVALYFAIPTAWVQAYGSRGLLAWNGGALLYLLLAWRMARRADARGIAARALQQDEGRVLVLLLVVAAAGMVLLAIGSQLVAAAGLTGQLRSAHLGLAALTLATSWLFTQLLFALHYAHDFYAARQRGLPDVLDFPGTHEPLYSDFFYFACVIGTSGQTADVAFSGRTLRPIGALHCIVAYVFNVAVVGLGINLAASLLQTAG